MHTAERTIPGKSSDVDLCRRSLPADFLSVDAETMAYYLRKIDKCALE